ncbi:MAG: hypothetical protein WD069_01880 [Planctomycetales bacterium]
MAERQHTTPMLIRGDKVAPLHRLPFEKHPFDESWLQALLFSHPALIPFRDIEPIFADSISVCRELPTQAGPVDLVYANSHGFITLIETKLWRNPGARRSVVGQIIDYARSMSRWSYDDFIDAVRRAGGGTGEDPLVESLRECSDDFDESRFIDSVTRNLRLGRFLLLVVGDGIREDVEHMTEYLQRSPQLHFTLGLVEIGLYSPDRERTDELIVQPRIVARTREVERAIVTIRGDIKPGDVEVSFPPVNPIIPPPRRTITEQEFLEELRAAGGPDIVEFSSSVIADAANHDLEVQWGTFGPSLRYVDDEAGMVITFGRRHRAGVLGETQLVREQCEAAQLPKHIWEEYLADLAALVPGATREDWVSVRSGKQNSMVTMGHGAKGPKPPLRSLAPKKDEWFELIDRTIERIREALGSK